MTNPFIIKVIFYVSRNENKIIECFNINRCNLKNDLPIHVLVRGSKFLEPLCRSAPFFMCSFITQAPLM